MRLSFVLMSLGIFIMVLGSGTTMYALSTVEVGPVKVKDVPPFSATLIGIGAIIFLAGVGVYLKGK